MATQERNEIIRFTIAAAVIIGIDFTGYLLLIRVWPYSVAKAGSFICAGVCGFFINKYWTFQNKKRSSPAQLIRFLIANVTALGVNVLTNKAVLLICPGQILAAVISATIVTNVLIYFLFKWWVFRE